MELKTFEVRDSNTFLPVLCIDMNNPETDRARYLLRRCGYPLDSRPNILLTRLDGSGKATNDYFDWGDRTFATAHRYITDNWSNLKDGAVIDVEYILGESGTPKMSEQDTSIFI